MINLYLHNEARIKRASLCKNFVRNNPRKIILKDGN